MVLPAVNERMVVERVAGRGRATAITPSSPSDSPSVTVVASRGCRGDDRIHAVAIVMGGRRRLGRCLRTEPLRDAL